MFRNVNLTVFTTNGRRYKAKVHVQLSPFDKSRVSEYSVIHEVLENTYLTATNSDGRNELVITNHISSIIIN